MICLLINERVNYSYLQQTAEIEVIVGHNSDDGVLFFIPYFSDPSLWNILQENFDDIGQNLALFFLSLRLTGSQIVSPESFKIVFEIKKKF